MISFKLIEDGVFASFEDGEMTGKAYFKIDGFFCEVYKVEFPQDKLYLFQGLLRSVFNYATDTNAYIGKLTDESCFDKAETMNFIFDGKCWSNDIPTLLMGTCGSCGDIIPEI